MLQESGGFQGAGALGDWAQRKPVWLVAVSGEVSWRPATR